MQGGEALLMMRQYNGEARKKAGCLQDGNRRLLRCSAKADREEDKRAADRREAVPEEIACEEQSCTDNLEKRNKKTL
jgi:hypothetical protein